MKTKDRIIDVALHLFNEQGTGAVSTNHIAEAASLSPGNLYYHFRNKDEIIRALFERLYARWDSAYDLPTDRPPTLDDVRALVRANFETMWEYRFVYREILALLRHDVALHQRYTEVRHRGYQGFRALFEGFVGTGVLTAPADEATLIRLADLCWLISEFWLSTVEVEGSTIDATQMERGIGLMIQVLQPYIPVS